MSSDNIKPPCRQLKPANLKLKGLAALLAAVAVVAAGIFYRVNNHSALVQLANQRASAVVKVIRPVSSNGAVDLILPGTLKAWYSAAVYARVSGYLKGWNVDIGTPVKAGQELASIETPELDQQLKQAQASLETALANERLTEITSNRWKNLLKTDSVSRQEADEKSGDHETKKTLVAAARAEVERLRALASFKRITAPFDGVVTSRKTDIGALINAGHDAGHELFTVEDVHKLRLYVNVPQNYAHQISPDMKAQLDIPGLPGISFNAVLTASSRTVNENSGTMLIELQVNNADRKLMSGGYGNVHFKLPHESNEMQIPVTALVFRKEGMSAATLTPDNRVQFRAIQIGHDLGSVVEIVAGLSATDRVVDTPPDSLEQGDLVRIAEGSAK